MEPKDMEKYIAILLDNLHGIIFVLLMLGGSLFLYGHIELPRNTQSQTPLLCLIFGCSLLVLVLAAVGIGFVAKRIEIQARIQDTQASQN